MGKQRKCANCGDYFSPNNNAHKFCGDKCKVESRIAKINQKLNDGLYKIVYRDCGVCGRPFKVPMMPPGSSGRLRRSRRKFCSTKCGCAGRDMAALSKLAAKRKKRISAGKEQFSEAELAYHASLSGPVKSRVKSAYRAHIRRGYRLTPIEIIPGRECVECGVQYSAIVWVNGRYQRTHNVTCGETKCVKDRKRREKNKYRRRKRKKYGSSKNHCQRARHYGVEYENVKPFDVFDRDEWKCQGCGKDTPKSQRGSFDANAPELDHTIPISKGGPHTYDNTQCLCRACNGGKSDMTMDEWALTSAASIIAAYRETPLETGGYPMPTLGL